MSQQRQKLILRPGRGLQLNVQLLYLGARIDLDRDIDGNHHQPVYLARERAQWRQVIGKVAVVECAAVTVDLYQRRFRDEGFSGAIHCLESLVHGSSLQFRENVDKRPAHHRACRPAADHRVNRVDQVIDQLFADHDGCADRRIEQQPVTLGFHAPA